MKMSKLIKEFEEKKEENYRKLLEEEKEELQKVRKEKKSEFNPQSKLVD